MAKYSDPEPQSVWRHVKRGSTYIVDGFCTIEATMERGVIYTSMTDERVWVRPVSEFTDGRFEPMDQQAK
jgi:hypothetical protein